MSSQTRHWHSRRSTHDRSASISCRRREIHRRRRAGRGLPAAADSRCSRRRSMSREILTRVDGIFFPGSPSNVEPQRYAGPASVPGTLHDPHRDATTLSLIPRAVAKRRAGVRRVPRLPGDERRDGRHAAPARARGRRPRRSPRGQGAAARRAVRAGARSDARARRRCCASSRARTASA